MSDPSARWQRDALCAEHPEANFFPESGQTTEAAKALCARCLVREECLAYALANDIAHGVWGGTSPKERVVIRRAAA
jgi:WhiB family redox-sensing transcriptional regulator